MSKSGAANVKISAPSNTKKVHTVGVWRKSILPGGLDGLFDRIRDLAE
jgi:hypothetical protein